MIEFTLKFDIKETTQQPSGLAQELAGKTRAADW